MRMINEKEFNIYNLKKGVKLNGTTFNKIAIEKGDDLFIKYCVLICDDLEERRYSFDLVVFCDTLKKIGVESDILKQIQKDYKTSLSV